MFTHVYPLFHKEYPEFVINVVEASVRRHQQLIASGDIDIGFLTLRDDQKTEDEYIHIRDEELILVIPKGHPACERSKPNEKAGCGDLSSYPVLDLSSLKYEPFALMYRESTIYSSIEQIFEQAGFQPNVLFETARAQTILAMVAARLCCSIVPDSNSFSHLKQAEFFCLPSHPVWCIVASYKKNTYLSKPAQRFIELAADYWRQF